MATGFKKVGPYREANYTFAAPISSQTVLVGDLLELVSGATTWTVCTSSSNHFTEKAIATGSATTADSYVNVELATLNDIYEVESNASSDATHNGDMMVLSDKNTVNNTGTNSTAQAGVVRQLAAIGTNTDKRILVKFVGLTGIDPDLT
jgi:hypothetical protein